jgi:hypothetical protein
MTFTEEQVLIRRLTQAIKDITNAADAGNPYTTDELARAFGPEYAAGYEYLQSHGIEEIA